MLYHSPLRRQYKIDRYIQFEYTKFMEIVLDASAIIAVIADEPESDIVINCTKECHISFSLYSIF
jgi:hypothetical protein